MGFWIGVCGGEKSAPATVKFNLVAQDKTQNQALVNTIVSQQNREHFSISFGGGQSDHFTQTTANIQ